MAIDWDADVAAPLMSADVFGEAVKPLYQSKDGGPPFPVDGVFDNDFLALSVEGQEPAYASRRPVLGVRLSQFPPGVQPSTGDSVTVDRVATTYEVANVMPDGQGWALLELMTTGGP